ncbi:MAG: DUF6585 family protein [Anaerolineales bacterium]
MTEATAETSPRVIRESGAQLGSYRLRVGLRVLQWTSIVVGLIGGGGSTAVGVWRWTLAYTHYGPAVVWRWSLPWFLAAMGLAPAFFLGLLSYWRNRKLRLDLYPSGLIFRRGSHAWSLAWQDIRGLQHASSWLGFPTSSAGRTTSLLIETFDGNRIRIPRELDQFEQVVGEIKGRVYPRMQRAFSAAFNQGKTLHFGPIQMNRDGLRVDEHPLDWSQIDSASLQHGELVLYGAGGARSASLAVTANRIPNVDLCYQMIQTVLEAL